MPRVTVQSLPEVQLKPLPNVTQDLRVTDAAFGGAMGRALEQAGGQGDRLAAAVAANARRMQAEDDANAAFNAYAGAAEKARAVFNDPERGLYTRRGKDALGAYDEGQKALDTIYQETTPALKNEEQRRAFDHLWQQRRESELDSLARFVGRQRQTFRDEMVVAGTKNAVDEAVANYRDAGRVNDAMKTGEIFIRANTKGQSAEVVDMKLRGLRSAVNQGIIERAVIDDPGWAKSYLDAHRDEIDAAHIASIEKLVKTGMVKQTARDLADAITASAGDAGRPTLGAWLAKAKDIADPEVREAVETRLITEHARREATAHEAERANRDRAYTILQQTRGDIGAIPPDILSGLDAVTRANLPAIATHLAKGTDAPPNPELYYKLSRQLADDPAAFARANLLQYKGKLPEAQWEYFVRLQTGVDRKQADAMEHAQKLSRIMSVAKARLIRAGIDPTPKGDDKAGAQKLAAFQSAALQEALDQAKERGKPLNDDEIAKVVDGLLVKGYVRGTGLMGFFRTDKFAFERLPGEQLVVGYDEIPQDRRAAIEAELKKRNRPADKQAVEDAYTLWLGAGNR